MNSYPEKPIQIVLPFPPSVNGYWRSVLMKGRPVTLLSKKGREYRKSAAGALLQQGYVCLGILDRLRVHIEVYPPDKRKRDLDNLPKGVLDALTKADVWEDDSQIDDLRITREHIVKGGKLVVTINQHRGVESWDNQQRKLSLSMAPAAEQ